jgi:hypothetical protein
MIAVNRLCTLLFWTFLPQLGCPNKPFNVLWALMGLRTLLGLRMCWDWGLCWDWGPCLMCA